MSEMLFEGYEPAEPVPVEVLSPDRRRTQRQADAIAAGHHPLTRMPIEGVVVDDSRRYDKFCQAMVEGTTEFDWEGGQYALPEHLREGLRRWAVELSAWADHPGAVDGGGREGSGDA